MLATNVYLVFLRILHIAFGVAWAGSVFLLVAFVQPTARTLGPSGAPFMRELLGNRKLVDRILWIAAVTIAAGFLLYWEDWRAVGSLGGFVGSRFGLGLTIGALFAIAAFLIGLFGTRPTVGRLLAAGARLTEASEHPSPELANEVQRLQARLRALARTTLALLAVAVIAMATARYW